MSTQGGGDAGAGGGGGSTPLSTAAHNADAQQAGQQQQQQQQRQHQQQEQQQQPAPAGQPEAGGGGGGGWRRWAIAGIKAVLLLELAATLGAPLLAGRRSGGHGGRGPSSASDSDSEEDLDPADVLMDYLRGRVGLAGLRLLRSDQLRQAADGLITEDFQELGVKDGGKEIRSIVDEILQARENGGDTADQRARRQPERVGLGRVGPLRFRNKNTKRALAEELSPPAKAEGAEAAEASAGQR